MKTTEATLEELTSHCKNLQNALKRMHKKVWKSISTKHEAKRKRTTAKSTRSSLSVGGFVLVAVHPQKKIPISTPKFTGSYKITPTINERVYEAQYLVAKIVSEIHCSRLQFYYDNKQNVDIHLLQQIQHDEEFHVEKIYGHLLEGNQFQLQMKWLVLEEDTCESIASDFRDLVKEYLFPTDLGSVWKTKTKSMNLLQIWKVCESHVSVDSWFRKQDTGIPKMCRELVCVTHFPSIFFGQSFDGSKWVCQ
jgi:hypothetical protein